MRKGIKILKETEGSGAEAVRGKTVIINMHMSLPDGGELPDLNRYGRGMRINLARRDVIAGIRYGIEGMRTGGRRLFRIRPHLAYGSRGVPGQVPSNSEIDCEVELLEVRDDPAARPEDYLPGRKLIIFHSGEIARCAARWHFGLEEDGRCGIFVTMPVPGLKWRHLRAKHTESKIEPDRAAALFSYVMEFPARFPREIVQEPYSEGGDSGFYVDERKETLCVRISVWERGRSILIFHVAEDSPPWTGSELYRLIRELLTLAAS